MPETPPARTDPPPGGLRSARTRDPRVGWALAACWLLALAFLAGDYLAPAHSALWLADGGWTLAALGAVLGVADATRRSTQPSRRGWTLLLCGSLLWLAGQLFWDAYGATSYPPSPNPADFCWLGFAVLAAVGVHLLCRRDRDSIKISLLEIAPLIVAAWTLVISLLTGDLRSSQLSGAAEATSIAYPIFYASAALIMVQAVLARRLDLRRNAGIAGMLAGLVLTAVGFAFWAPDLLANGYVAGTSFVDAMWVLGMLAFGTGAWASRPLHGASEVSRSAPNRAGALPAATFVLLAAVQISYGARDDVQLLVLALGLAIVGLTLIAHAAALRRRQARLVDELHEREAELRDVNGRLSDANALLSQESRRDVLTGLFNRLRLEEDLTSLARQRAEHSSIRFCLILLDLDRFKDYNDNHGHQAGDEVLARVGRLLSTGVRGGERVYRYGGEELLLVLRDVDLDAARALAERLRRQIEELAVEHPSNVPHGVLTASAGLAAATPADTPQDVLRRADIALYEAKIAGRNRVVSASTVTADFPARRVAEGLPASEPTISHALQGHRAQDRADLQAFLLEEIDASVLVTDLDGLVISWNRGAEALYGWSAAEAVGRNVRELIVPEDTGPAERLAEQLSSDGSWNGELLVRRKNGESFMAYVRNRLLRDEAGEPAAVVGVAIDISARVAAVDELQRSRDYAQAITESMGEGLFTLDRDCRLTYMNRTAESLLGWSEAELRGKLFSEAFHGAAAATGESLESSPPLRSLLEARTIGVEDDVFTVRGGGRIPVSYTAAPFSSDGTAGGCVVVFQDITERKRREEEHRRDAETIACLNRVEQALAEDRFLLYAQPILDLHSGRVVKHELLLRMRERDGQIVAPGEFLPVAEQSALIGEIDWWVIKQATRLAGLGAPVQLNISARSVGDPDVLEHIERCVEEHDVQPGSLVFEITETAIVKDERAARTFAERLHVLGCEVALDDFGTGYGTLTYLKQIPVDYLKLDIEFVSDLTSSSASRHVVDVVVAMAREFKLRTVGEGVEDAATLELLSSVGVDFAQGYYIARPAPFADRPSARNEKVSEIGSASSSARLISSSSR
jgi:diguanylate cyclase (GGDEF)-like protein/PAS domain S-box-containing protein